MQTNKFGILLLLAFSFLFLTAFIYPQIINKDDIKNVDSGKKMTGQIDSSSSQSNPENNIVDETAATKIVENIAPGQDIDSFQISSEEIDKISSCLSEETKTKLLSLVLKYKEAKSKGDTATIQEIKNTIISMKDKLVTEMKNCNLTGRAEILPVKEETAEKETPRAICVVPIELREQLDAAWKEYENLIKNMPPNATGVPDEILKVKEKINQLQEKIKLIKQECMAESTSTSAGQLPGPGQAPGQAAFVNETCAVPIELTQTFEGLVKQYNEAMAKNDTATANKFAERIKEIKQKLEEARGQCVKAYVHVRNAEVKEVVSSYVQQIQELKNVSDEQERNRLREMIKNETKIMLAEVLKEKKQLNVSEVAGIAERVRMRVNQTELDDEQINGTGIKITTRIRDRIMNITNDGKNIVMEDGGLRLRLNSTLDQVDVTPEGGLRIMNKAIAATPSEVQEKLKMKFKNIEMKIENNTLVYSGEGIEERKLFGIFKVAMDTKVKINAENEQVMTRERPWWAFLTTE